MQAQRLPHQQDFPLQDQGEDAACDQQQCVLCFPACICRHPAPTHSHLQPACQPQESTAHLCASVLAQRSHFPSLQGKEKQDLTAVPCLKHGHAFRFGSQMDKCHCLPWKHSIHTSRYLGSKALPGETQTHTILAPQWLQFSSVKTPPKFCLWKLVPKQVRVSRSFLPLLLMLSNVGLWKQSEGICITSHWGALRDGLACPLQHQPLSSVSLLRALREVWEVLHPTCTFTTYPVRGSSLILQGY